MLQKEWEYCDILESEVKKELLKIALGRQDC